MKAKSEKNQDVQPQLYILSWKKFYYATSRSQKLDLSRQEECQGLQSDVLLYSVHVHGSLYADSKKSL